MINSEYCKQPSWGSSDLKYGKELLFTKLLHITQDKWSKRFCDDTLYQSKKSLRRDKTLPPDLPSRPAEKQCTHDTSLPLHNVIINVQPNAIVQEKPEAKKFLDTTNKNRTSHVLQKAPLERNLPFIREMTLKPNINTKKHDYGCEKCKLASFATSPEAAISPSQMCVKDKINFFENVRPKQLQNKFLVNIYSSKGAKEWLHRFQGNPHEDESFVCSTDLSFAEVSHEVSDSVGVEKLDKQKHSSIASPETKRLPIANCGTVPTNCYKLLDKINIQCILMVQAAKALRLCRQNKQTCSSELLEAERALLVEGSKRELLIKKFRKSFAEINNLEKSTAEVSLSNIRFPLKTTSDRFKYRTWYIALVNSDSVLYSTEWTEGCPSRNYVYFSENFVFGSMSSEFVIEIRLFQMRIARGNTHSTMSCIQMNNRRLHRISQLLTYKDLYSGKIAEVKIPLTSFTFCAQLQITKDSLQGNYVRTLNKVVNNSALDGTAYLHTDISNLSMNADFCGFLTVGTELMGRIVWDRKWCYLRNSVLCFWDYPTQEESEDPKLAVNLKYSRDENIEVAGKGLCSRSRTLIIRIEEPDRKLEESVCLDVGCYYITADSVSEMEAWRNRINSVLMSLKLWQ